MFETPAERDRRLMEHSYQDFFTFGPWGTEVESVAALDRILSRIGFVVYTEVPGRLIQPRIAQELKTVRIDRVLVPTEALKTAGWTHGIIGIECKRSGEKIGPPVSQCIDYSRALWQIRDSWFALNWVFLWPANSMGGTVASIMAQQRIGVASSEPPYRNLWLMSGQVPVAQFDSDGWLVHSSNGNWGRKVGSR